MIFRNNKYLKHVLSLIILTSCATASKNKQDQNFQVQIPKEERAIEEISEYKKFFDNDLNIIQEFLESEELNQDDKRQIRLLKTNYKKQNDIIKPFFVGFMYATIITGILYYLIKYIAS